MSPLATYSRRAFDPSTPRQAYEQQLQLPTDVFSVLLLLGGDVVNRALGQLVGRRVAPVAFSFGWVAYAVSALVACVGENKLMPAPDCACIVLNGREGNVRQNTSWVIGRIVRDFWSWCPPETEKRRETILNERHASLQGQNPGKFIERPKQTGLVVSVFEASDKDPAGVPVYSALWYSGIAITIVQFGIAAIPCGVFGDWGVLMITLAGVALSLLFGMLPQWRAEKWACRKDTAKITVLTRGNGSQHAIVILGRGRGLDLEDLAAVEANVEVLASLPTRLFIATLSILWVFLLIAAAGTKTNTWFLLGVGGLGILQNTAVAGWRLKPKHLGVPLRFLDVIGEVKVMATLLRLEEKFPHVGHSLLETFFQGTLNAAERAEWDVLAKEASQHDAADKLKAAASESEDADEALAGFDKAANGHTTLPTGIPKDVSRDELLVRVGKASVELAKAQKKHEKTCTAAKSARDAYEDEKDRAAIEEAKETAKTSGKAVEEIDSVKGKTRKAPRTVFTQDKDGKAFYT